MTDRPESAKLNWPRWQQALLIALLVLVIGNRLVFAVDNVAFRLGPLEKQGTWGAVVQNALNTEGFSLVTQVTPGGPMEKAGVRPGDRLRFEVSYTFLGGGAPGERINFTLDRGGTRSERQLTLEPRISNEANLQRNFMLLLNALGALVSAVIACFILWRGWGNVTAMLLGAAVSVLALGGLGLPGWASPPIFAYPMLWLYYGAGWMIYLTIPFAMRMFEESVAPLPRWHWRLAMAWLVFLALFQVLFVRNTIANTAIFAGGFGRYIGFVFGLIGFMLSISYLIAGWRRSSPATRSRFTIIIFALSAYLVARLLTTWSIGQTGYFFAKENADWLNYGNALMMGMVAPGLLGYAVLRHKLFDLGFAVNRTLVFGAIGGLLLVSFALIEWAIKQAIPKVWYGGSVYISAVIAVGLYLTFNRLHHKVEHAIERLFFHKWQVNEAALKRFVAAAAHVEKPETLAGNYVVELVRFSGGAAAALYTRTAEGHYASAAGDTIDADDPALAAMRAEQGAVVPAELGSPIEAALALPMMHQAALAGFVLLGPKPAGEDYRPDEIEVLGWATQQVGLDMQAIRVRELEQSVIKLEARNANLSDILAKAAATPA